MGVLGGSSDKSDGYSRAVGGGPVSAQSAGLTRQGAAANYGRRTAQFVDRQSKDTDTPLVAKRSMTETHTAAIGGATYVYTLTDTGSARIRRCATERETLAMPAELDGHRITAIDHSALAGLKRIVSIELPDSIADIGWNAFANCPMLRRLRLPSGVAKLDKTWFAGSTQIEELVLPDAAKTIDAAFLKACKPLRLVIGRETETVEAPAIWTAVVREIAVAPENPHLSTDGTCLYTRDGTQLIRSIVEREDYRIADGCRAIGPHAFEGNPRIRSIELPHGLESIGEGAFEESSIAAAMLPESVLVIGEKAFLHCASLAHVRLNSSLVEIGPRAFAGCTALEKLAVGPAVELIGKGALAGTGAQLSIDERNGHLAVDAFGLLYRRMEGTKGATPFRSPAWELIDATEDAMEECIVRQGTRSIGKSAFANHARLTYIELPDGLEEIGESAFECCPNLRRIELPDSVRSIGRRAFFCTPLESIRIPAGCTRIDSCALAYDPVQSGTGMLTAGASDMPFAYVGLRPATDSMTAEASGIGGPGGRMAAADNAVADIQLQIRSRLTATPMGGARSDTASSNAPSRTKPLAVTVDEKNPRYFTSGGLLCERIDDHVRVLLYIGPDQDVSIPAESIEIAPYAFAGARGIARLTLHDRVATVGAGAMSMAEPPIAIRIELAEPIEGHASIEAGLLEGREGIRTMRTAFASGSVDAKTLLAAADRAALSTRSAYAALRFALERLADPVLLSEEARTGFSRMAGRNAMAACVQIAAHEWTHGFDLMADLGFLSRDNIDAAIEKVNAEGHVAMTVQLIALKRRRFDATRDYDL